MISDLTDRQREIFNQLVDSGVYSSEFEHSAAAQAFVGSVLDTVITRRAPDQAVTVLDCGCGTGAWLQFIHAHFQAQHRHPLIHGFDLSDRMAAVARQKLANMTDPSNVRVGNVLDRSSFAFPGALGGFDLIFTYDVVQQLPRRRQFEACVTIAGALAPGGMAIVFDNDSETRFGRRMAFRKFLTRYFGLRLVPRYYCNAAYPPLERFRRRLAETGKWRTEIIVSANGIKRALLIDRNPHVATSD